MATLHTNKNLTVTVALIIAMDVNGVIGLGGALPWHLPADLNHFKRLTTGHTVVMGRKTFDSIGKPLANRQNVVLTRDRDFREAGVIVAYDLADALRGAEGEAKIFVAGGAEIYRQTIAKADKVYQTLVHSEVEGDTRFTEFDPSEWHLVDDEFHEPDADHGFAFSFRLYERPTKGPVS